MIDEKSDKLGAMQLVVSLDENGQVRVDGPIDNLVLAYGLLEVGRDAIMQHSMRSAMQKAASKAGAIVSPSFQDVRTLKLDRTEQ